MIDFEITVDVSNLSVVEKMRVQDAFFELGIGWPVYGEKYSYLDKNTYTNLYMRDYVVSHLLYSDLRLPATHSPKDLFKLVKQIKHSKITNKEVVDMSKNNLKPFNLEAALAGEPVVTRDGQEATQVTLFDCSGEFPLIAVVNGGVYSFTKQGRHYNCGQPSSLDLFMKPKTRIINGFEVPLPESESLEETDTYYVADTVSHSFYETSLWSGGTIDMTWLSRGLVFLTKEDAIANAKAMLGIDPYKE